MAGATQVCASLGASADVARTEAALATTGATARPAAVTG